MQQPPPSSNRCQPLALGSFRNWLRLLWANRGVDRRFWRRACFVSTVSFLTIPFRLYERARYRRRKADANLRHPPIFVIGHWRSGTTALHQLLCKDPALGYVSTFQSIAPEWFLTGGRTVRGLVSRAVPAMRLMDNMPLTLDDPQEEEFAVAEMSPFSFYHQWSFPRNARQYFERYALFRGVAPRVVDRWRKTYLGILDKAAWLAGHRRLAVKNPVNTARIRLLLEIFPDAKFIHIYRNPYVVFPSTRHFFQRTLAVTRLQEIGDEEIEANILWFYEELMQRFFADKDLIPPGNLVEVRFEQFEVDPLGELRRVYETLGLPGFDAATPAFHDHVASLADYRKNHYSLDAATRDRVERHWRFAIERWNYEPPSRRVGGAVETVCP